MLIQTETKRSTNTDTNWHKSLYKCWHKLKQSVRLMLMQIETNRSTNAETNWKNRSSNIDINWNKAFY